MTGFAGIKIEYEQIRRNNNNYIIFVYMCIEYFVPKNSTRHECDHKISVNNCQAQSGGQNI